MCIGRVLTHDLPFFIRKLIRIQQDVIWNAQFADVVQQRAAADMSQLRFTDVHLAHQLQGHFCDAQRVSFRLLVAQVHGPRPALDGGVIGCGKVGVRTLQVVK